MNPLETFARWALLRLLASVVVAVLGCLAGLGGTWWAPAFIVGSAAIFGLLSAWERVRELEGQLAEASGKVARLETWIRSHAEDGVYPTEASRAFGLDYRPLLPRSLRRREDLS